MANQPQHTPEPWDIQPHFIGDYEFGINDCRTVIGKVLVQPGWRADDPRVVANAERIVQCVNACAGIANPEDIPEVVATLREVNEMLNNHFGVADACEYGGNQTHDNVRAALAKLEGK